MHCLSRHRFWSWVEPTTHCFFIRSRLRQRSHAPFKYFERPVDDQATKIVDHGHASQHLQAAMVAYYGDKSVEGGAA